MARPNAQISPHVLAQGEATAGASGGALDQGLWEQISRQEVSAVSEAVVTWDETLYDQVILVVVGLQPATDSRGPLLQISDDDGATFESGATDYEYHFRRTNSGGTTTDNESTGDNEVVIGPAMGGVGGESMELTIKLSNPSSTTLYKNIDVKWNFENISNNLTTGYGGAVYNAGTQAINGMRLYFDTAANIGVGTFILLGLRKDPPAGNTVEQVEAFVTTADKLTADNTVYMKVASRRYSMNDELADSKAYANTAPSGGAVAFDVQVDTVSIATITFADGVNTATFVTAGGAQEDVEIGERLEIVAPTTLHSINEVSFNLKAFLS